MDFMLPFELLFHDIKGKDLSICQIKSVKSKIWDTTLPSFDSFSNNKIKSNLFKEEFLITQIPSYFVNYQNTYLQVSFASFNVKSLFTNTPSNEFISICINDLFCDCTSIHHLDCNDRSQLLTLIAYGSFLILYRVMYWKTDGVAMGSLLGPILANAFYMSFWKKSGSQNVPLHILLYLNI